MLPNEYSTHMQDMPEKKIVIVLGMHRSGTSTITRALQVMGVQLGNRLLPAMDEINAKGFWEDADLNALNIEMLQAINSDWHRLSPVTSIEIQALYEKGYFLRAVELMQDKVGDASVYGFKDPRMAMLLSFWKSVFSYCQFNVSYVLAVRHPMSVAKSLAKRDCFDREKSYLLWLGHVISSLTGSVDAKRVLVDYDCLMLSPERELIRIAECLDLRIDSVELQSYISQFLDQGLRHTFYELNDLFLDESCPPVVQEIYTALLDVASDHAQLDGTALQDKIMHWSDEYQRLNSTLILADRLFTQNTLVNLERDKALLERDKALLERDKAQLERDKALSEQEVVRAERDSAVALANLMRLSASWRLTTPLRFVARLFRYGITYDDRRLLNQSLRHTYHRLPLPATAKNMVSFAYHRVFGKAVRSVNRGVMRVTQFHAPKNRPLAQQHDKSDYIVWGVIDWHFRHQRPQQLALALAETGRRVFYVSPSLIDDERNGFEAEALDVSSRLFQLKLFVKGSPVIYSDSPGHTVVEQLRRSMGEVLNWANSNYIVSLVQHPFWHDIASVLPNSRLVYDCMDHHAGFGNNFDSLLQLEKRLLSEAELTITTSTWLDEAISAHAKNRALIRNAGEYEHFAKVPGSIYRDQQGRRIIGYYGAIAEWFDQDLVEAVAKQYPDCCILLIGADSVIAKSKLAKAPNIEFVGEVPYSQLPYYLHSFDVCLLPFKIIPLTLATNPVKVYEYLSAGKPVVTVDLPEMSQFDGLVYTAPDHDTFIDAVGKVLSQQEPDTLVQLRRDFAKEQTWKHRSEALIEVTESPSLDPTVSIIVVTYNNLKLTQACLASLDEYSHYDRMDIIVVDNASTDGSQSFLEQWAATGNNRNLILNNENRGFAAANNQGLELATGDYLVMLNNDTYVTPGWVRTLIRHLRRDGTIGLIGPVTNNIGNEAKIDISYNNMGEMLHASAAYTRRHLGENYPLRTAAFFCVMMPRTTYELVGKLDEAFGRGFFEDDDYCRRIEQKGLRVVCAEDVFVHHHLSASFNKLKQQERQKLFEENRKIYEAKWGEWMPHVYRS